MPPLTPPPSVQALHQMLSHALDDELRLIASWPGAPQPAGLQGGDRRVVIYAFPSRRLATLRHWRDELEIQEGPQGPLVAFEASKWARLLLKSHGATLLTSALNTEETQTAEAAQLPALAQVLWDPRATAWCESAGLQPLPVSLDTPHTGRFESVERWLAFVRQRTDAFFAEPDPP